MRCAELVEASVLKKLYYDEVWIFRDYHTVTTDEETLTYQTKENGEIDKL